MVRDLVSALFDEAALSKYVGIDNTFVDGQKGASTRTFWTFLNQNKATGSRRVLERILLYPSVRTSRVKEAIGRTL
jgi:hypothetical protein